jgi:hypothetical protein
MASSLAKIIFLCFTTVGNTHSIMETTNIDIHSAYCWFLKKIFTIFNFCNFSFESTLYKYEKKRKYTNEDVRHEMKTED